MRWDWAISADGTTIVGEGASGSGTQAFRWTAGGGMAGLGDLAGGASGSVAYGVSADGSVVVGAGRSAASGPGREAFRWTSGGGMAGLTDQGCLATEEYVCECDGVAAMPASYTP